MAGHRGKFLFNRPIQRAVAVEPVPYIRVIAHDHSKQDSLEPNRDPHNCDFAEMLLWLGAILNHNLGDALASFAIP